MNVWSKGDDAAVCLSYLYHGVKATPELLAALSHLTPGSIRMRLQNVQYLATDGASGLSGVAAQTHEVWARVSALLDAGVTPTTMNDKASPGQTPLDPSRSLVVTHAYQMAKQGAWDELLAWWGAASVFAIACSRYRNASSGWTFLHQAAYFGNEAASRELIRWGARVNAAAANRETPADTANRPCCFPRFSRCGQFAQCASNFGPRNEIPHGWFQACSREFRWSISWPPQIARHRLVFCLSSCSARPFSSNR